MIALIATIRTKDDLGPAFEEAFAELAAAVNANEPGNHLYRLTRVRDVEGVYKVLEIYESEDAVDAHRESAHFKELGAALGPFMDGRPDVERLDVL